MASICDRCRHFRPFRPMSQRILRELGRFDQQLISQLVSIIQDERQVQDEEATMLVELFRRDLDRWDARPAMSDYCGAREVEGVFLLHEVANRDGDCPGYDPGPRPSWSCHTCDHRVLGDGPAGDQKTMDELKALALEAVPAGMNPSTQDMTGHLQLVGASKSFEAAQAYYLGRFLFERPRYLSSCTAGSTAVEYAACVVRNPDDGCADWTAADAGVPETWTGADPGLSNHPGPATADRAEARDLIERLKRL